MLKRTLPTAALAFGAASLLAWSARATDCTTLPNPVYAGGSTAVKVVLAEVAQVLAAASPPVTVIYLSQGSCVGVSTVINKTAVSGVGAFTYWDGQGNALTCDVAAPGVQLDIGLSDVFPQTCVNPLPPNFSGYLQDNHGPVQAMTFAVPASSTQMSISAEAAYSVFGFGNKSGITPWNDVTHMFQRGAGSGTQGMIATAIKVPALQWYGVIEGSTSLMQMALNMVNGTPSAESTIGILAAEDAETQPLLRELAYQHYGQNCGYLPNSTSSSHDKRNVRDGHYAIWGPMHLIQRTDIDNQTNIGLVVSYMTGSAAPPGVDLIQFEASKYVIPQCAMRVKRSSEVGAMSPQHPPTPCGCYYDSLTNGATTCKTCTKDTDCSSGYTCPLYTNNHTMGWCEQT